MTRRSRLLPRTWLLAVLCGSLVASACSDRNTEPAPGPAPAQPAALTKSPPTAAQPSPETPPSAPAAEPAEKPKDPSEPEPGWSKLWVRDTLPICVFSSYDERRKAPHIERVTKQKLSAGSTVVFGVFGPWCLNAECDRKPLLQCWIDREGENTFVVSSRFYSVHKDGSTCTTDCLELDAGCETPPLAAGKYTIRHGDQSYELKIPSTLRSPCLNVEKK